MLKLSTVEHEVENPDGPLTVERLRHPAEAELAARLAMASELFADSTRASFGPRGLVENCCLRLGSDQCHRMLGDVSFAALGLPTIESIYVRSEAGYQATIAHDPIDAGYVLTVSADILEDFSAPQLRFVVGHELGHQLFGHTSSVPELNRLAALENSRLGLLALSLNRYQELSADRLGLVCAGGAEPAIAALAKLMVGRPHEHIQVDKSFASVPVVHFFDAQLDGYLPWQLTHPPLALRQRALLSCARLTEFEQTRPVFDDAALAAINGTGEELLDSLEHDSLKREQGRVANFRRAISALVVRVCSAVGASLNDQRRELITRLTEQLGKPLSFDTALPLLNAQGSRGRRLRIFELLVSVGVLFGQVAMPEVERLGRALAIPSPAIAARLGQHIN